MPKASSKKKAKKRRGDDRDEITGAVRVMNEIIRRTEADAEPEPEPKITDAMRKAAAAFGRIGGRIGGKKRAASLSDERKREIAKKAAEARWAKSTGKGTK